MFFVHVKEGLDSQSWQDAVVVVRDLVWSVQSQEDEQRASLLKMIPSLLQRLRNGFSEISFNKIKMRMLLKRLEAVHLSCLKSCTPSLVSNKHQTVDNKEIESMSPIQRRLVKLTEETIKSIATQVAESEEPSLEDMHVEREVVESPTIIENVNKDVVAVDNQGELQEDHAQIIGSLSVGSWVEIFESDENKYRAKLAAIIRATGKYIFVNRVGMKVAEKTQTELITCIEQGSISILDSAMLFDRALESVIGHLREMRD